MSQVRTVLGNRPRPSTPPPLPGLGFKNLRAFVEVDGAVGPLPCHAVCLDRKDRNVSCWIASEDCKKFSVNLVKEEMPCSIRVDLFLDGKKIEWQVAEKREVCTVSFDSIQTSDRTKRPFVFAPLKLTDDDSVMGAELSENFNKIGEIKLEVRRITRLRDQYRRIPQPKPKKKPKRKKNKRQHRRYDSDSDDCGHDCCGGSYIRPAPHSESAEYDSESESEYEAEEEEPESRPKYPDVPEVQMVHEKSRKAQIVPHQIAYGEEQVKPSHREGNKWATYSVYSELKELVASFTFRYRPLDVLVNNYIVRPNPVPRVKPRAATPDRPTGTPLRPASEERVQVRVEENDDDINAALAGSPRPPVTPALGLPPTNPVGSVEEDVKPGVILSDDDGDDDEICNGFDESIKALMAQAEQLRADKRKRREEIQGPKKRVKMEPETLVFFSPGEVHEVIDLT